MIRIKIFSHLKVKSFIQFSSLLARGFCSGIPARDHRWRRWSLQGKIAQLYCSTYLLFPEVIIASLWMKPKLLIDHVTLLFAARGEVRHPCPRGLLPRRLPLSFHGEGRFLGACRRLPPPWRHQHFLWHAQVRLRAERLVLDYVSRRVLSPATDFRRSRLARRHLRIADDSRKSSWCCDRSDVGGFGSLRRKWLCGVDEKDRHFSSQTESGVRIFIRHCEMPSRAATYFFIEVIRN